MAHRQPVIDPTGQQFKTITAMCEHWGIEYRTFKNRRHNGATLEEALRPTKTITDHLGQTFHSAKAMCRHWGINSNTYFARRKKGLDVQTAITGGCKDHEGNWFPNITDMCKHWHISIQSYYNRIAKQWTQKQALTTPTRHYHHCQTKTTDHTGKVFPTFIAMCEAWGQKEMTVRQRMQNGMSLEKALTTPVKARHTAHRSTYTDHTGQTFSTFEQMCQSWGHNINTVRYRLQTGKTLEEALTTFQTPMKLDERVTVKKHVEGPYYIVEIDGQPDIWTVKQFLPYLRQEQEI